jgi:hypothetical protein
MQMVAMNYDKVELDMPMENDIYKDYTREQLVEEYLETQLASFVDICGVDRRWMPKDVSRDPAYWKSKDKDLHDMHYEIARRYHIKRDDCLWLENLMDGTNLYVFEYQFKAIVKHAIETLEKLENRDEL